MIVSNNGKVTLTRYKNSKHENRGIQKYCCHASIPLSDHTSARSSFDLSGHKVIAPFATEMGLSHFASILWTNWLKSVWVSWIRSIYPLYKQTGKFTWVIMKLENKGPCLVNVNSRHPRTLCFFDCFFLS